MDRRKLEESVWVKSSDQPTHDDDPEMIGVKIFSLL